MTRVSLNVTSTRHQSLWLTSDGGTLHYSCGTQDAVETLGERYRAAGVATPSFEDCCQNYGPDQACIFDVLPADGADTILSYALARAEGRTIDPPYICPVHRIMTFGGCCS